MLGENQPLKNKSILVADDESIMRDYISDVLEDSGAQLRFARDGQEAWELYAQDPCSFDIALLDVRMPRKSGIEVCNKIIALGHKVKVVFCSGFSESEQEVARLRQAGDADFIAKPFMPQQLLEKLQATH